MVEFVVAGEVERDSWDGSCSKTQFTHGTDYHNQEHKSIIIHIFIGRSLMVTSNYQMSRIEIKLVLYAYFGVSVYI